MAARRRRAGSDHGRSPGGPVRRKPLAERIKAVRLLQLGVRSAYEITLVSADYLGQRYAWRVSVVVPAYEARYVLRMEVGPYDQEVFVEGWSGQTLKHTFGGNSLCMWYPNDPPEKRWRKEDGLLKLIDTALLHLFKEHFYRETGEWLGEEVVHGGSKVKGRPSTPRAEAA